MISVIIAGLLLCSCSLKPAANNALPRYSDMSAAEDAGRTLPGGSK